MGFEYLGDADNIAGDGRIVRERMMYLLLQKNSAKPSNHDFEPPDLITETKYNKQNRKKSLVINKIN